MAYAFAYIRSIQAGFDSVFGDVIHFLFVGFFFGSPPPPAPQPLCFMLMTLSSVYREVFVTLLFSSIVNIFLCFPSFPYQETA